MDHCCICGRMFAPNEPRAYMAKGLEAYPICESCRDTVRTVRRLADGGDAGYAPLLDGLLARAADSDAPEAMMDRLYAFAKAARRAYRESGAATDARARGGATRPGGGKRRFLLPAAICAGVALLAVLIVWLFRHDLPVERWVCDDCGRVWWGTAYVGEDGDETMCGQCAEEYWAPAPYESHTKGTGRDAPAGVGAKPLAVPDAPANDVGGNGGDTQANAEPAPQPAVTADAAAKQLYAEFLADPGRFGLSLPGDGYDDTASVFALLDMDGDGTDELIVASITTYYGGLVSTLAYQPSEERDQILDYGVYTVRDGTVVCLLADSTSYSTPLFQIYDGRAIVTTNTGTGYMGYVTVGLSGSADVSAEELAIDWSSAELDGQEDPYFRYGAYASPDDIGMTELPRIQESEFNERFAALEAGMADPVFYDNTPEMRQKILLGGDSGSVPAAVTPTVALCERMAADYGRFIGMRYSDLCQDIGLASECTFIGEGEEAFLYTLSGVPVELYFDECVDWEARYPEPPENGMYTCTGESLRDLLPAGAKCRKIMLRGKYAALPNGRLVPDPHTAGQAEEYYPEGPDFFYYAYSFVYGGYGYWFQANDDGSIDGDKWLAILLPTA